MSRQSQLEKEILKIKLAMEKLANKDMKPLLKEYKKKLDELRAELGAIYMKYDYSEDGLDMTTTEKFKELRKIEKFLISIRKDIGTLDIAITGAILDKIFKESYYQTAFTIDKGIEIGVNFNILKPEFVNAVINANFQGQKYSDRIWNNKDWLVNKLYQSIEKGIKEGTSIKKLSKAIKNTFGSAAFQSDRLIRTEMARVQSIAQDKIYKDSGLVGRVMYNATLDEKTSEICEELDGQIFDINSDYPKPPQHPNCRSVIIPIVDGWSPIRRRDNSSKEIIEYKTYNEWAKSKGIS